MPSPTPPMLGFTVDDVNVERALYELRRLDKDLFNEMRRDFRREIRPIARELQQGIPRGGSPLSGMSRSPRLSRTSRSVDLRGPFVWKLPGTKIDVGTRRRGRRGTQSIVRIRFTDKRPYSAFSVLETARQSNTQSGQNMIAGIEQKYKKDGKGRWVIQPFYERKPEMIRIAQRITGKYMRKVSRRLARKVGVR